ncbi:MAG: hypothetical protein SFX19_09075 [Alphaproteobacteria bacterium]|nr:hypothetical protein [Alphaproteobacteria bacterium]
MTGSTARRQGKRGRPKIIREEHDRGTPELQFKRLSGDTLEALDLCLEKGAITPEQHWCGIHLRWLYTLRYGAPGVRAVDFNHVHGLDIESDDPTWRESREAEYHAALKYISDYGFDAMLVSVCIHNERPCRLTIETLSEGLQLLVKHWKRGRKKQSQS